MKSVEKCFVVVTICAAIVVNSLSPTLINDFLKNTGKVVSVDTHCDIFEGRRRNGNLEEDVIYKEVDWYLGIPFATSKRFEKPQPYKCQNKTINGQMFADVCVQENVNPGELVSEDCLNLNIYTPVTTDSSLLPVMVYIHGGSYSVGKGKNFIGDNLAQHGVVIVTINYRLNVFGFLSAPHPKLKGNYGFFDQIEALKWVNRFINYFRGDPQKVTIFGNSAGGSSVGFHTLLPYSKGLFSQVIMQSGSPTAFWATSTFSDGEQELIARDVARYVGCHQKSLDGVVACLKNVTYTPDKLRFLRQSIMPLSPVNAEFIPRIDGDLIHHLPIDSKFTFEGPFMAGIVSREFELHHYAWFMYYNNLMSYLGHDLKKDTRKVNEKSEFLFQNYFINYTKEDVKKIHDHYKIIPDEINLDEQIEMLSDIFLVLPTLNFALMYQNFTKKKAYFYEFNHITNSTKPGNYHEVELNYIFGYNYLSMIANGIIEPISDAIDLNVSRHMMKLWTNFAKYGNPNDVGIEEQHKWTTLSDSLNCFIINSENSSMVGGYKSDNLNFWNNMKRLQVRFPQSASSSQLISHIWTLALSFLIWSLC